MRGAWLRLAACAGVVALASLARADAPLDQYAVFGGSDPYIQDNYTGLIWQRAASRSQMVWLDMFGPSGPCTTLSFPPSYPTGWRVPSYKELMTLVDEVPHTEYEGVGLVEKAIDIKAFFGTDVGASYWTSSIPASQPSKAYVIDFRTGEPALQDAAQACCYVRCVHDGDPTKP
jgi:hypothetical protein